jgi:hypothetical protein
MTKTNVVSAVMSVVMQVARGTNTWCKLCQKWTVGEHTHESHTEGTDKSGAVVTRVAHRRGKYAPQRENESTAQYHARILSARNADAERKRAKRTAQKDERYSAATTRLQNAGRYGAGNTVSVEDRDNAVRVSTPAAQIGTTRDKHVLTVAETPHASYPVVARSIDASGVSPAADAVTAELTTRYKGFSKALYRRGHYGDFLISRDVAPFSVWPKHSAVQTRDRNIIAQHLDNHFRKVADARTWQPSKYQDLAWTNQHDEFTLSGLKRLDVNEHVYRAMNQAQRSKANPLLSVGVTPATVPYVNTFQPASPAPFTQTERLDHSRVRPVAGASDKVVAKCAPVQGMDKDGKPLPFTYGGSVPNIPADMHGLWCDRDRGGVYGNGQTDIACKPVPLAEYHKANAHLYAQGIYGPFYPTVIDDSPRGVSKASLFVPANIRFERKVSREFSEQPLMCATVANGRKRLSIAAESSVTPQYGYTYPRLERCYNR